jgi:hypothetical protein
MSERKPRGRRPKDQKRVPLSIRITPALRELLVSTARANGRSITQEAEIRLEHAVRDERRIEEILDLVYGPCLAGVLMALGQAMQDAGRGSYLLEALGKVNIATSGWAALTEEIEKWVVDPNAFEQSIKAAVTVLEFMRPEGEYLSATESTVMEDHPESESNQILDIGNLGVEPSAPSGVGHASGLAVLRAIGKPGKPGLAMERRWSIVRGELGPEMVTRIARRMAALNGGKK